MPLDIELLRKVFGLEKKKGYDNTAVSGGLEKFLRKWCEDNAVKIANPGEMKRFRDLRLDSFNYTVLTPEQRKEWLDDLLGSLDRLEAGEAAAHRVASSVLPRRKTAGAVKHSSATGASIDASITVIKGISSSLETRFHKLDVRTVRDLLYFFPHRHLDYSQRQYISQLEPGAEETIIANVWQAQQVRLGGRHGTEAIVGDETGNIRVVWFNNPYLAKNLSTNSRIVVSGKVSSFNGRLQFESPEWEMAEEGELVHTGRLVPVYPLTKGLRPRQVRKLMKQVVDRWAGQMTDPLPPALKSRCKLLDLPEAIAQAHFPEDGALKDSARHRLAFDELFLLQLGVLSRKRDWQEGKPGTPFTMETQIKDTFIKSLPFKLTLAQQKVLDEILADLKLPRPMSRLLQGEVGSGKTVVAMVALLMAAANEQQGAFMAPTEILAEQHFASINELLAKVSSEVRQEENMNTYYGLLSRPLTVAMLIGDIKSGRKQELQQRILSKDIDIVIGTHALIQKDVAFNRLGLVVVDEQHRFGVAQRSALRQKGFSPHVLVMTATPIPRTLALTLYGDLDLSVIDELPPGRQEIKTKSLKPEQRDSAYVFLQRQVAQGRQAFIICPLVEESDAIQAKAAMAEYERLSREVFPGLRLGLLHGRMSAADKDKVMRRFRSGELDILVSTPVVEVGIDVPNATVMMVESADRFGLSQLHQFRGRVGRGEEQSYCMLLADNPSEVSAKRLGIIQDVKDGFRLAEADLELRGPGEFFGTRQSGLPDLRMAKISDVALLELARREAIKLFQKDPGLAAPEHRKLASEMARVWTKEGEWS